MASAPDGSKTWDLGPASAVRTTRPPQPSAQDSTWDPLTLFQAQPVPTPLTFDTAATLGQPAPTPGSSASSAGCLASIQLGGAAARDFLHSRALPQFHAGVAFARVFYAERAVPAAARAAEYGREVVLPAAKTFLNETALPAARDAGKAAVAYSQTVVVPALQQGYTYTVEVALPQAQALVSGTVLPPRPVQVSTAVETEREATPPQEVPTVAGSDLQLPVSRQASPEPLPVSPAYTTMATTVAATVAPETEQRSPLLDAHPTFATVPLTPRDQPEALPAASAL